MCVRGWNQEKKKSPRESKKRHLLVHTLKYLIKALQVIIYMQWDSRVENGKEKV